MKPAIPIGAAFVIGLVAATLVGMRQAPPPADEPSAAGVKAPASVKPAPDTGVTIQGAPSEVHAPEAAPTVTPDSSVTPPLTDSAALAKGGPNAAAKRLAAVFAKLPAADIVPIAEHISDDDLVPALKQLDIGTTASVLALMPAARAKLLSKRLLVTSTAAKP